MPKSEVAWTPRSTVVSPLRQKTAGTPLYPQPVFHAPRMWCVAAVTGVGIADHWDGKIGDCERQMLGKLWGRDMPPSLALAFTRPRRRMDKR